MNKPSKNSEMEVTFWGVRGTLPVPGDEFRETGGNTNCISVRCGSETIVIDAGTGIRRLGRELLSQSAETNLSLLLTHAHYDHVEGIPFFAPLFQEGRKIGIYSGPLDGSKSTHETVSNLMQRPYFPVGSEIFTANIAYEDLNEKDTISLGDGSVKVEALPLNHPGGATGYRIEYEGYSFACVTDTEHRPGKTDETVLALIDKVDLFIYDCSLTAKEFPQFEGYGHSTYEEAVRLAKIAGAGQLRAFHHMPFRTDTELLSIEREIEAELPGSGAAREQQTIVLKK